VRSIFSNLLQQYVPSPPPPPKTIKRARTEGIYGEEITSSNRLNELKEKSEKLISKKRPIKSARQTSSTFLDTTDSETTTRKRRRLSKQRSEMITSSQVERAVATLHTSSSSNTSSTQNNTI
jgi:hypothetical protein